MAHADAASPGPGDGGRQPRPAVESQHTVDVTFLSPLDKFDTDLEQLAVGDQVVLRRVTDEDRQLFREPFRRTFPPPEVNKYDFVLETTCPSRERTFDPGQAMERFRRVVTAFRLINPGAFELPVLLACQAESRALVGAVRPFVSCVVREPYWFRKEDADELQDVVGKLCTGHLNDRQSLALRRFEMAYERWIPEDRLIDHWIALEALFLPGISDELSFRASLRIAYYMTASPDERQRIFDKMRLSYDTRSRIVHGEPPKADVGEVASDTEEILRRALRAEVTNLGSLDVERLDAAIARGGSPEQEGTLE